MSSQATPAQVDTYLADAPGAGLQLLLFDRDGASEAAIRLCAGCAERPAGRPTTRDAGRLQHGGRLARIRALLALDRLDRPQGRRPAMVVMLAFDLPRVPGRRPGLVCGGLGPADHRTPCTGWGIWLGNRFRGDAESSSGSGSATSRRRRLRGAPRARAIAEGIKATGAGSFHGRAVQRRRHSRRGARLQPLVDLNSFYGYGPCDMGAVYETANRAYRSSGRIPAWMEEGTYEYENNTGTFSGQPWDTREGGSGRSWAAALPVMASGRERYGSGRTSLPRGHTPGAAIPLRFDLFATLPWWKFEPSGTGPGFAGFDLMTRPVGARWATRLHHFGPHRGPALAPRLRPGDEPAADVSVDAGALDGRVRARWFDPATGTYLAIGDGQAHPMTGVRSSRRPEPEPTAPTTGCSCSTRPGSRGVGRSRRQGGTRPRGLPRSVCDAR